MNKQNLKKITLMDDKELYNTVKFGYELEFQKIHGMNFEQLRDDYKENNENGNEAAYESMYEHARNDNHFSNTHISEIITKNVKYDYLIFLANDLDLNYVDELIDAVKTFVLPEIHSRVFDYIDECFDEYISEIVSQMDIDDYLPRIDSNIIYTHYINILPDMVIKADSSVDGGEITSEGPNSLSTLMQQLTYLFEKNEDFEIDEFCSFHIHASIPEIKHSYGIALQRHLMTYILSQSARWPLALHKRLNKLKYYELILDAEKYRFVSFNREYKTWEFRFFGNISNKNDALICFKLVAEAFRYAYSVLSNNQVELCSNEEFYNVSRFINSHDFDDNSPFCFNTALIYVKARESEAA